MVMYDLSTGGGDPVRRSSHLTSIHAFGFVESHFVQHALPRQQPATARDVIAAQVPLKEKIATCIHIVLGQTLCDRSCHENKSRLRG